MMEREGRSIYFDSEYCGQRAAISLCVVVRIPRGSHTLYEKIPSPVIVTFCVPLLTRVCKLRPRVESVWPKPGLAAVYMWRELASPEQPEPEPERLSATTAGLVTYDHDHDHDHLHPQRPLTDPPLATAAGGGISQHHCTYSLSFFLSRL